MFKTWSQSDPKVKENLKPDLWLRDRDNLNEKEKYMIWKYLERDFFDKDIKKEGDYFEGTKRYYEFFWDYNDREIKQAIILKVIQLINHSYKANNYTPSFLEHNSLNAACLDFYNIFSEWKSNIVLETLSIYWNFLINVKPENIYKKAEESEENFSKREHENQYIRFDRFAKKLNDVLWDFWINIYLTRLGFIPKQEEKITTEIYEPVIKCLWWWNFKEVERDLSDAFSDYRNKDYSWSITKWFSALQGFLQTIVYWSTWKWDFSPLIKTAIKENLIPNDIFTETILKNIESVIARERMETGDPHPKNDYATEKWARLFLNLTMIFIQHCLQ